MLKRLYRPVRTDGYTKVRQSPRGGIYRLRRLRPLRWTVPLWLLLVIGAIGLAISALVHRQRADAEAGTTLATVNGRVISSHDLEAEGRASGIPAQQRDAPGTRATLVNRIVDRRLLVDAARAQGIDRNPRFLEARARSDELLLASAIAQRLAGGGDTPAPDAVTRYMASHPGMFAKREGLTLDVIRFTDTSGLQTDLAAANTMEDVEYALRTRGVTFDRQTARIDTASLPAEIDRQIRALKPGEVFVLPQGQSMIAARIVARVPIPTPPAEQRTAATAGAAREASEGRMATALKALRAKATITYAPGMAPPTAKAAASR